MSGKKGSQVSVIKIICQLPQKTGGWGKSFLIEELNQGFVKFLYAFLIVVHGGRQRFN
jgi:hypothetical protein